MHAGQALWNLCLLTYEQVAKAQNDPVLAVALESCQVLSDFIKVPLPDQAALAHLARKNDELRGVQTLTSVPAAKPPAGSINGLAREALDHCNYILDNVDEVPEKGAAFADSLRDKATSMKESITKAGTATDRQVSALENMHAGLDKWLNRE